MRTSLLVLLGVVLCLQLPSLPVPGVWVAAAILAQVLVPVAWRNSVSLGLLGAAIAAAPALQWQRQLLPIECNRTQVEGVGWVVGLPQPLGETSGDLATRMRSHRVANSADERTHHGNINRRHHRTVTGLSPQRPQSYRFDIRVVQLEPARCAGPSAIRLYAQVDDPLSVTPRPGDVLRFTARVRRPHGMVNPFANSGEKRFLMHGIHAVGSIPQSAPYRIEGRRNNLLASISRIREDLSYWIRQEVRGDIGILLAALAVGDKRFISSESWERLRLYGITHLLVISGLHITLFALPGWWFGRGIAHASALLPWHLPGTTMLPAMCAFSLALVYAALAGFSLPVQRALLMLILGVIPRLMGRAFDSSRHLALCAIGLLLFDPLSILGGSYWLSLGAVATLFMLASWSTNRGWLKSLALTQCFMLVWSVPLGLFWFQSTAGAGAFLNLLAIPLISFLVVPPLLLSVVLHLLDSAHADSFLRVCESVFGTLWSAMAYWQGTLESLGQLRSSPGPAQLALALAACALLILPGFRWRLPVAILLFAPLLVVRQADDRDTLRVLFLDVGQGTAVLIQQGGETLVYDTGGGPAGGPAIAQWTLLPQFVARGIDVVDWLVISHPDRDHDAGHRAVETSTRVRQRRFGRSRDTGTSVRKLCRQGERMRLGTAVEIVVMSSAQSTDSDNNASCVLRLEAYGRTVLLPGDIDSRRERELLAYWGDALEADVLLAAHHGSGSSSSALWLRSVSPIWVIATAGKANRFGHPAGSVVSRVRAMGAHLLNTADHGAIDIQVHTDGSIHCSVSRHRLSAFWRRGEGRANCGTR
ncbi:MAG: DNA internalization-related competence protein ComEC/Rec2 [Congregibacter sp.]